MFYFIRHGKTDYSERNTKIYQGFGVNLAPLGKSGISEIQNTAKDPRLENTDVILSSPYTRALQTAAILSREIGAEIVVETDLHEWMPNKDYICEEEAAVEMYLQEYTRFHGVYPAGLERPWETAQHVRWRVLGVLKKYSRYHKVIVACHGLMIQAVTGKAIPENGEIVEFYTDFSAFD